MVIVVERAEAGEIRITAGTATMIVTTEDVEVMTVGVGTTTVVAVTVVTVPVVEGAEVEEILMKTGRGMILKEMEEKKGSRP